VIGIVGAGLTGLALAHELARRGVPHVVLEADDRAGGVIRSDRIEGRVLERGPQRARLTTWLQTLVGELGLQDDLLLAPADLPLFVYAAGRLRPVPFSVAELARTDLLSWPGRLRMALEPLTRGPRDDESVAELLTRKLGRQAYERMAGPLYGGLYASDPADMEVGLSLAHVLRELRVGRSFVLTLLRRGGTIAAPRACSFTNGLQAFTDALHQRNRGSVRLSSPVRRLSAAADGWSLEGDGGASPVERVVLTCPAPAAAALLAGAAPEAAGRIAQLRYNPLAVVHLDAGSGLRGLGYQVALSEPLATLGVTWNDALFGRDGVHTAYLGGAKNPAVVKESDDRLGEIAAREFEEATGRPARALAVARAAMPAWDRSWRSLAGLALPPGVTVAANWWSRPGIQGRLDEARRVADALAAEAPDVVDHAHCGCHD
jgi:oxygen-dependent protoporphyrinogen oxidase